MKQRPKLNIQLSKADKAIELFSFLLLVILWGAITWGYSDLPGDIPKHFNMAGQPDGTGSKTSIIILPVVASVIFIILTVMNRYPHVYNYGVAVTNENAQRLYTSATKLIRILKLVILLIFTAIVFMTYRIIFQDAEGLGIWFLPVALTLLIVPTIFYLIKHAMIK